MPPRLGHKKSRNGCVACKRRRVKCDEQRPCGACVRYGWQCSLTQDPNPIAPPGRTINRPVTTAASVATAATDQDHFPAVAQLATPPAPPVPPVPSDVDDPNGLPPNEWLQDLELLHQYTVSTSQTMSNTERSPEIWQKIAPRIASRHEHLMHGLLAVSALHLAHLLPAKKQQYCFISAYHQNISIPGYRAAISTVTQDTADAVFLASIVIATFAFASSGARYEDSAEDFGLSDVTEVLILVRGVEETLCTSATRQWIMQGPLVPLVYMPQEPPEDPLPKEDMLFLPHLTDLHRLIERRAEEMPPDAVVSLSDGLHELKVTYEIMMWARPVMNSGFVMRWPNVISMSFLTLLQDRHPIALVMLAYFCAMTHYYEERWIWHGWSGRAIDIIKQNLDEDWQRWVEVPAEIVEKNLKFVEVKNPPAA